MRKKIKKLFPTFISSTPHHINMIVLSGKYTMIIAAFMILALNIIFSQNISSLYFGLMENDIKVIASYLRIIKPQPYFKNELAKWQTIHGSLLTNLVYDDELTRQQTIKNLEQVLEKNKNARDVLYGLSILYRRNGEEYKADGYLQKAKEIDPNINN